eukprot:611462-Pleurochrysis_carterae.AAC.1
MHARRHARGRTAAHPHHPHSRARPHSSTTVGHSASAQTPLTLRCVPAHAQTPLMPTSRPIDRWEDASAPARAF